jgi:hypothetical protein
MKNVLDVGNDSSLPMFLLSFFEIPIGVRRGLIIFARVSFGKAIKTKRNIDSQNGTWFVGQRTDTSQTYL